MKIYALVGRSGTGKSYKALEVACENNIEYLIDDGLLIYKNKIVAGISAKQSKTYIEAVKRAIFNDENHRKDVKDKIKEKNIQKILVIGTSNKMVKQIVNKLELGEIYKYIYIEDISTYEEIELAKRSRERGNHIIPVSTMEIKPIANGLSINSLKRKIFKNNSKETKLIEKTVIRPTFSYRGKFFINKNVIREIIAYELSKFEHIYKINKINISENNNGINLYISININNASQIKKSILVQETIKENLYKITSINIVSVDIFINKLKINNSKNEQ